MNSGRLEIISATVSPRVTPEPGRPPANASTFAASSVHVQAISSSFVRTAMRSALSSTVSRKASAIVAAPTERLSPMGGRYRRPKPPFWIRSMSLLRPITNSISTSAKPTNPARSMTANGIALPRTFSASAQKMCPPSSGRNGNRLMTPRLTAR